MVAKFKKDPEDVLDYQVLWSQDPTWVADDTITDSTFVVAEPADDDLTPLVVDSDTFTDTVATAWFSGGTDGTIYEVVNHITTAGGREMDKVLRFTLTNYAR